MTGATRPNTVQSRLAPAIDEALAVLADGGPTPWGLHPRVSLLRPDATLVATNAPEFAAGTTALLHAFDRAFGGRWAAGDAALSNDVDSGCAHVCELAAVAPYWRDEAAAGPPDFFLLLRVQVPDLGGWELGGYSPRAVDRWAEAARFEPARFTLSGRPRREVREMLALNSRTPATMNRIVDRLQAALESAGATARSLLADDPGALAGSRVEVLQADLEALDARLGVVPEGSHAGESPLSAPFPEVTGSVRATVTRAGEAVRIELAAPPPSPRPVNLTEPASRDFALAALAAGLGGPALASGAALERVAVSVAAPSAAAAGLPFTTGLGRQTTGQAVFRAVLAALLAAGVEADPDRAWSEHLERWIGHGLDLDTGMLDGGLTAELRTMESKEADDGTR